MNDHCFKSEEWGPKIWRLKRQGFSLRECAEELGLVPYKRNVMIGMAYRHGKKLEAENRDLQICELLDSGLSEDAIAERFDVKVKLVLDLKMELEALDGV